MRKWLRISIVSGVSLVALIILLWLGLALYIHVKKQTFLDRITREINTRINGKLTIKDVEPSLLRSFPDISMALQEVTLQDSLWQQHRHNLLTVERIFVKINTFSLLQRKLEIKQVTLEDGTIYLYTNPEGYTNTKIFRERSKPRQRKNKDADIARLQLQNMHFVLENLQKQKLFRLDINSLKGHALASDTGWTIDVNTNIHINDFAFNTAKGSYLKNKDLAADLHLQFNRQQRALIIPQQNIYIDKRPVSIGGVFSFAQTPPDFRLHIVAAAIPFRSAASLLSPNISHKLDSLDLHGPLDIQADLQGHMKYRDTPLVHVSWQTTGNTLVTKAGEWTDCSFSGGFNNELHPARGHNDENSVVHMYQFKGRWLGMPLQSDTVRVVNLKHPTLTGHFRSNFQLTDLNPHIGGETFQFRSGTASVDLYYKGGVNAHDTVKPFLQGTIQLQRGAMTYLPRNMDLHDCNATLSFTGHDLFLQQVRLQSSKSTLLMEGSARNILNLYFSAPEKILLDWDIRSPLIDLNEFRFFLSPRKPRGKAAVAARHRKNSRIAHQLNVVLESCNVNMRIQLDKLNYRRFSAQQVKAQVALNQSDILLNQVSLSHAGGSLQLKGDIRQQGNGNRLRLNADINNVHIDQLFYAFDNFGMQSLNSKNLKGILSAKATINGNILDNAQLASRSLGGTVSFDLRQGALINFEPLEMIGTFFFRKRNLSNITFENLRNTLTIRGGKITIPPMQINSSALNMDISGVYGFPRGTDINLDVPLRNPQKDENVTDREEKRKRRRKGIVLHLHATDDNKEGKVKIKLK